MTGFDRLIVGMFARAALTWLAIVVLLLLLWLLPGKP